MINRVELKSTVKKELRKAPEHIVVNFQTWVALVEEKGLDAIRKVPGFHDEPLKGKRKGQRSIRLSRSWRAIYTIESDENGYQIVKFVLVREVSKHEY